MSVDAETGETLLIGSLEKYPARGYSRHGAFGQGVAAGVAAIIVLMPAAPARKIAALLGVVVLGALLAAGTMSALAAGPDQPAAGASGLQLPGDPQKGQQAYNGAGCTSCHGASLEGGVGPRLNPLTPLPGAPSFKNLGDAAVADFLIDTITNGKQDGSAKMPAKGGAKLSDQDIKDITAYLIQSNTQKEIPLSPVDLARSNVFWVSVGIGVMVFLTYLLAQYNMRWIARRAAARKEQL